MTSKYQNEDIILNSWVTFKSEKLSDVSEQLDTRLRTNSKMAAARSQSATYRDHQFAIRQEAGKRSISEYLFKRFAERKLTSWGRGGQEVQE